MAVKTNVNKNGNKYFRITRTIGHKEDGTPIKKEFYGNSKSDAEEKANQYLNDLKNGLIVSAENYTISQLMHIWLFDFLNNSSKAVSSPSLNIMTSSSSVNAATSFFSFLTRL